MRRPPYPRRLRLSRSFITLSASPILSVACSYRLTDTQPAELSLAPQTAKWSRERAGRERHQCASRDDVYRNLRAGGSGSGYLRSSAPSANALPADRARRHRAEQSGLCGRVGNALPPRLSPIRHLLNLLAGRFREAHQVVKGSLDPPAPAEMRSMFALPRDDSAPSRRWRRHHLLLTAAGCAPWIAVSTAWRLRRIAALR